MSVKDDFIPGCYAELYSHYFDNCQWVISVVRRFFKDYDSADMEDMLHECWGRMHRQQLLERYDPSKGNFGGLVYQAVKSECLNRLSLQGRTPTHNALDGWSSADEVCRTESRSNGSACLFDTLHQQEDDDFHRANVMELRDSLEVLRNGQDDPRKLELLDILIAMSDQTGGDIAEHFGVGQSTISTWKKELHAELTRIEG